MQKKVCPAGSRIGQQWGSNKCANTAFGREPSSPSPPSPKRSNDNCYSPEQFSNRSARRKRLNATYFYFNFFSNCFSVAPVSESKRRSKVKAKFYEKLKRKCEVFV